MRVGKQCLRMRQVLWPVLCCLAVGEKNCATFFVSESEVRNRIA